MAVSPATTGCSADGTNGPPTSLTAPSTAVTAAPGGVSISPAGVTTKVNVPAHSTEEEYFQACHAAKTWMAGHPGEKAGLVERYLAAVQVPGTPASAGTWNIAWAALPPPRQAGVIVAAQAAANDECG